MLQHIHSRFPHDSTSLFLLSLLVNFVHFSDDMFGVFVHQIMFDIIVNIMWVELLNYGPETLKTFLPSGRYTVVTTQIGLGNNKGIFVFNTSVLARKFNVVVKISCFNICCYPFSISSRNSQFFLWHRKYGGFDRKLSLSLSPVTVTR